MILKGLLSEIGKNKLVATMGWCWGGTWAFKAGVLAEKQNVGVVMYYGFPEEDEKKIKPLNADVLYVWASRDKFIPKSVVDSFEKKVEATGHDFALQTYDADHAFANPSNPKYDMMAAKQAEQLTLKFLRTKLQVE
jgi:carboxymethylenebutenolidase